MAQTKTAALIIACLLTLILGLFGTRSIYNFFHELKALQFNNRIALQEKLEQESKDLAQQISTINYTINNLVDTINNYNSETIKNNIIDLFKSLKIEGAGIAFLPSYKESFALHFKRHKNELITYDISKYYTFSEAHWFNKAQNSPEGLWLDPYVEPILQKTVVRFAAPVFSRDNPNKQNVLVGVVYVDLNRAATNNTLELMAIGNASQAFIMSKKKTIITSPFAASIQSFDDIAQMPGKSELKLKGDTIVQHHKGIDSFYDGLNRKHYWIVYEFVPSAEWIIVALTPDTNPLSYPRMRKTLIQVFASVTAFLIILTLFIVIFNKWHETSWWSAVIITSLLLLLFVCETLYLHHNFSNILDDLSHDQKASVISNEAELERFKQLNDYQNLQANNQPPIYVPTGILITFIDITQDNQIALEGFVWQKYKNSVTVEKNISLLNTAKFSLEKSYYKENSEESIIGWHFKATALNWFDFLQYPFDKQLIKLNFFHPDIEKNIVLTPDFSSYELFSNKPALKQNTQISSWQIRDSFFYYYRPINNTSMGLEQEEGRSNVPDFYFALSISRDIISSMAMAILPLAIIAVIVFFVLLQTSGVKRMRSSIASILPQLSAIFFACIIAHQSMRRAVTNASTVVFVEYYYFLIYMILILVAINSVIYLSTSKKEGFFFTRKNLSIQLLYWPLLFLCADIITLYFFY